VKQEHILIVSSIYPPDEGGPATFSKSFGQHLKRHGFRVTVLCYADLKSSPAYEVESDDIEIIRIDRNLRTSRKLILFVLASLRLSSRRTHVIANGSFLECIPMLILRRIKFTSKIPGDIVWERACQQGLTESNVFDFQDSRMTIKYQVFRKLFTFVLKKSVAVIVPAKYLFDFCAKWGVAQGRLTLIGNSVDVQHFCILPSEKKYDLITVGRLVPVKQIEEIITVASKLDLSLCVVGSGPLDEKLRAFAQELGARIYFLGNIDQDSLPLIYSQSKIFVQNSQIEATSYALLEARASGLFAVASELTGASEVIHHAQDGLLFGKSSGLNLWSAIQLANSYSPTQLQNYGLKAREDCFHRFNRQEIFNRINEIMNI